MNYIRQIQSFNMRCLFTVVLLTTCGLTSFSQDLKTTSQKTRTHDSTYTYAYILVEGKVFSKKLKVNVDFGDTPEQLKSGKEYSERLTNKKSYAAVLNYMVESGFQLVQTLDYTDSYGGSGGTSGIVFIMMK